MGCVRSPAWLIRPTLFPDSSAVEHSTVNRMVVGSNPTRGAIFSSRTVHSVWNFRDFPEIQTVSVSSAVQPRPVASPAFVGAILPVIPTATDVVRARGSGLQRLARTQCDVQQKMDSRYETGNLITADIAAALIKVTRRRVQQLVKVGWIRKSGRGAYPFLSVVHGYVGFLQDEAGARRSRHRQRVIQTREHRKLRTTPAIAAGRCLRLWKIGDIVKLVEDAEAKPAKRGPFKKTALQISN